jgi:hypothetical protein
MRAMLVAVLVLGCVASRVDAHGYCDEEMAGKLVADVEALASGKKAEPSDWGGCVDETIAANKPLSDRLVAACTTIVQTNPDDSDCIVWSIEVGAKQLGALDLFQKALELFPIEPFGAGFGFELLATLDDPRALPRIRDAWADAAKDRRARSSRHEMRYRWARWRHTALRMFASHGAAEDTAFLTEQLRTTDDRGVRLAIHRTLKAIAAR